MATRVVYLAERGEDIYLSFYLGGIGDYFGLSGIYNCVDRHGDEFHYGGVRVRRFELETKRGVYVAPKNNKL